MNTSKILEKPFLRGRFHEAAAFVSLGAGLMLVFHSHTGRELVAATIYAISLFALFGISALYHRIQWSPTARTWMRRLDHAAIFLLIAGTSTAVFLMALPDSLARQALLGIWIATLVGIVQVLFWIKAPKWLAAVIYIVTGWTALPYLMDLYSALGVLDSILILVGGFIYSVGAVIYALKRPNPWPRIFGYHEIFHIAVILAAILHFVVIYNLMA